MSQNYKIVERLQAVGCDCEPFTHEHAKCVCRTVFTAASLIQELGEALEEMVSFIDRANDYELVRAYRFKPYDDAKAILSKLKEA